MLHRYTSYDNHWSQYREYWYKGKMIYKISASLLEEAGVLETWKDGQILGNFNDVRFENIPPTGDSKDEHN